MIPQNNISPNKNQNNFNSDKISINQIEPLNIISEEPQFTNITKNNSIKEEILQLTVMSSTTITLGTKLKIDKNGLMEGSLRNKKDNITYFGYMDIDNINNYDESIIVDYILPQKQYKNEDDNEEKYIGRYFQISYNLILKNYYIRDLGYGLGTFIKIKDPLLLKDNFLISIGDSYLVINLENSDEKDLVLGHNHNFSNTFDSKLQGIGKKLRIKLFEKNKDKKGNEYIFPPNNNKIIRIGRKKHNNDIELDDSLVSKINCNIQYNPNEGWYIKDGNEIINSNGIIKKKESTNGTWFLAVEDFEIYNGMIFKGNFNLFYCNIIQE